LILSRSKLLYISAVERHNASKPEDLKQHTLC
jgi:hypothetical protein